jgi:hypothetical protein
VVDFEHSRLGACTAELADPILFQDLEPQRLAQWFDIESTLVPGVDPSLS